MEHDEAGVQPCRLPSSGGLGDFVLTTWPRTRTEQPFCLEDHTAASGNPEGAEVLRNRPPSALKPNVERPGCKTPCHKKLGATFASDQIVAVMAGTRGSQRAGTYHVATRQRSISPEVSVQDGIEPLELFGPDDEIDRVRLL